VASNPGRIPAGGRDFITVEVDTSHRGGSTLNKGFTVFTNDRRLPSVRLQISGKIKGYISLSPQFVRLIGNEGQKISMAVNIRPMNGHTFSIKTVRMQKGRHITYDLKPLGVDPRRNGYTLIVQNTKQSAGSYLDYIFIETDSAKKPMLRIPVSARIRKETPGYKLPPHD
jgi:hypothetical protein